MLKKIITITTATALLCLVGIIVYADSNGVFLQDNDAAMNLVDKYFSSVMKIYTSDGSKVSFRGIVKQGCDFWYYNEYNNKDIVSRCAKGSSMEVTKANCSITYDSIKYSNKTYTIEATVTRNLQYPKMNLSEISVFKHTILIEQNGSEMYIINDESVRESAEYIPLEESETDDTPEL